MNWQELQDTLKPFALQLQATSSQVQPLAERVELLTSQLATVVNDQAALGATVNARFDGLESLMRQMMVQQQGDEAHKAKKPRGEL